jgi:hypothetical protein
MVAYLRAVHIYVIKFQLITPSVHETPKLSSSQKCYLLFPRKLKLMITTINFYQRRYLGKVSTTKRGSIIPLRVKIKLIHSDVVSLIRNLLVIPPSICCGIFTVSV